MIWKDGDWAKCRTHGHVVKVVSVPSQDLIMAIGCHGTTSGECLIPYAPTDGEKWEVVNDSLVHALIRLKVNREMALRNGWSTAPYDYKPSFDINSLVFVDRES